MKLSTWIVTAFSAVAAALLPACDAVNLPEIKPGITTQAEVRSRMGEPGFVHEYSRQPAGIHCYMIGFDGRDIVSTLDQVLTPENFARVAPGMRQAEIRRLLGQPAHRQIFRNLGEEVWDWRIQGDIPTEETFFSVYFDLNDGTVRKSGQRVEPKNR